MRSRIDRLPGSGALRRGTGVLALALMLPVAGCDMDALLTVDDLDVATPESLKDPNAVPVVYAGALSDFSVAYGGSGTTGGGSNGEGQILLSGMLGDEFIATGTFNTRLEVDRRAIPTVPGSPGVSDNGNIEEAYQQLHDARVAAENGAELFALAELEADPRRAELYGLAGFTYNMFGENYCSGVPYSRVTVDGEFVYEGPSTTEQTFERAIERFEEALAIAAPGSDGAYMALIGKARAQLNLGRFAEAAATASSVPTDFVYTIFYAENTSLQENGVWHYAQENGRYGVTDMEGGEGLPYRSANDPRVPWYTAERANFDASLPFPYFAQSKYATRGADIPLATGVEARLIEAEAALQADPAQALPLVNELRARVGLDPLASLDVETFFQERGFWLWLTSHRLGDMRRQVRQYGMPADQVYPSGEYFRAGLTYGNDLQLPIHQTELQNPEFQGCLDRDA